jgi:hypothetical protein
LSRLWPLAIYKIPGELICTQGYIRSGHSGGEQPALDVYARTSYIVGLLESSSSEAWKRHLVHD